MNDSEKLQHEIGFKKWKQSWPIFLYPPEFSIWLWANRKGEFGIKIRFQKMHFTATLPPTRTP